MPQTRRTAEEAEALLKEWEASGLRLVDWSRQKGIRYETVRRWRCKLRGPVGPASSALIPVRVVPDGPGRAADLEIGLANGLTIRVPAGFDAGELARVLGIAQQC